MGGVAAGNIGGMRKLALIFAAVAVSASWGAGEEAPAAPDVAVAEDAAPLPVVSPLAGNIPEGAVVVIPLQGAVSKAQFIFMRRVLKDAEAAKASAFILDMDTPGGEVAVTQEIVGLLSKATVPTYTWVNPNAASAGALIALGTKHVYMAPISAIGAAAPVLGTGADVPETMKLKVTSYSSAYFRGVAAQNGYNPNLVDAFMDEEKEFKIGDDVISPAGSLLTLNALEATKEYEGKPLLADGIVDSIGELKERAGLTGVTVEVEPSGFERAALVITMLAPLFLLGGIIGTYIEFKSPGFGVPGMIAAVCFLLFFAGHYIAGLTGMEVVAFFVLGVILVLIELVFLPGIVVLALAGVLLMVGALLWAMVDYYPDSPEWPTLDIFLVPLANLGIAIGLALMAIVFLAKFFPKLPVLGRLVLTTNESGGGAFAFEEPGAARSAVRAGERGRAVTMLRPVGRAEFGGEWLDARAEGDFLPSGTPLVALRMEGSEVVVERARD